MKQFIAFVKKEFYHIFRDRRTMLILLGMPVVQIILFGFAISTEVKNVRLAVLDPSNDVVTRKIIDRLDASEYFTVTRRFHSPREMEAAFLKNKIDMVVVFNEHFADGLYCGDARVQLIVDATDDCLCRHLRSAPWGFRHREGAHCSRDTCPEPSEEQAVSGYRLRGHFR